MTTFTRGRADWISHQEEEGEEIPWVVKLNTSDKITVTRANSITLIGCIGQRVVVTRGKQGLSPGKEVV